jgi:cytochrome c peroxidase
VHAVRVQKRAGVIAVALAALTAVACGDTRPPDPRSALARLGDRIFHDPSLSASGRMSCATCHDAAHAFAATDGRAVPLGGPALDAPGRRNAPSLMYAAYTPAFSFDAEGTPTGGMNRDGRAASLAEQARGPLLGAFEMANASIAEIAGKLGRAAYATDFRQVFGAAIFEDPERAFESALLALQQYQREDTATFAPFSSRYDRFLAGEAQLDAQEMRGLELFEDPQKGNCAACHPSRPAEDGAPPLFTDYTYDNIGAPRNPDIAANADPSYFDLGLCGPQRADLAERRDLCGAFKVPTLRNVALTAPYLHNGVFVSLREVVDFYVRRDTHPEEWYPAGVAGAVHKYDDLPPQHSAGVNTAEAPYDREPGDAPALSSAEIDDVVAFLRTLTDASVPDTGTPSR